MDISITGAKIFFTIPLFGGIPITETQVNSLIIMAVITGLCIWLTRGMTVQNPSKKQAAAEFIVNTAYNFVQSNMTAHFRYFTPFVAALFAFSAFGSLSSLTGMYPITADYNTVCGWAVMVFFLITFHKIKSGGFGGYIKGFTQPIAVLTPFNVISELATPVSMSFRHFGNVASGSVISALLYGALAMASSAIMNLIRAPEFLASIPFLQLGVPAIFSIYFDVFSGVLQAFIFCMLTMLYIASAAGYEAE